MGWLLHELALESVLIVLFVTRWAIEWWATGRVNRKMKADNDELIADSHKFRDTVLKRLGNIEASQKGDTSAE